MPRAKSCYSLPLPGPLPDHGITHMVVHCLSPEKLNKIPEKKEQRKAGQAALAEAAVPICRLPGPHLQSVCSSQQGQISSLKVRAAPAWQAVPSQCGLGLPRAQPRTQICSGSIRSGCTEAAGGNAEPSLVLPLLPGSLPQQGNALPSPSPAPCSSDQEKNWSRVRVTTGWGGQVTSPNPSHPPDAQWGAPYSIVHRHRS